MNFFIVFIVFLSSLLLTAAIEALLIPFLKQRAKQPIYEVGPAWHMSKAGTPTMGGLAFVIASTVSLGIVAVFLYPTKDFYTALSILISLGFAISNALIGVLDDLTKLRRSQNAGLSPMQKLVLQFFFATAYLFLRKKLLGDTTSIALGFGAIDLGILYYPLAIFLILGIINCANLTDGVDGLASCTGFFIGIIMLLLSFVNSYGGMLLSAALVGSCLMFLFFNHHPAKIFMGDTGSLFIGAMAVTCAFSLGNPLLIIFIGAVYVFEGVSVVLQVIYYKISGKRLFKMAPFHHHLEKCGYQENTICIFAIILTILASIPAFLLFQT